AARLRMDEKRLREFMLQRERWTREAEEWIARRRVEIEQIHARLLVLQKQYRELKRTKVDSMQDKIHEIRLEMNHLRGEFKLALRHWRLVLKQPTFVFTF
ncbi:MAG: hypothetical protein Q7S68_00275, partial [Deltaproteobacteria bacterium]|nr:hypothetical protein [Deltaproteobacteria bacterium]